MSELSPEQIRVSLAELANALRPVIGRDGQVALYTELARRLSTLAHKKPPWGWRYIQGVERGSLTTSHKLARAVLALGAELDGVPLHLADTQPVQVYARPGSIRPGSLILGESKTCARPGCTVNFVPRVPWQRFCCRDCRDHPKPK